MPTNIIEGIDITTASATELKTLADFVALKKARNLVVKAAEVKSYADGKDTHSILDMQYAHEISSINTQIAKLNA